MNKVVLLCLTLFAPVNYKKQEVIGFLPDKIGHWPTAPSVKICDLDISEVEVRKAIDWWRVRGYKFGYIVRSKCLTKRETGFIYITLPGQSFDFGKSLARTHLGRVDNTSTIIWAHIEVTDAEKERLLEHEIGHALGWTHSSIEKHMMHPSWQRGGWIDKGVSKNAK